MQQTTPIFVKVALREHPDQADNVVPSPGKFYLHVDVPDADAEELFERIVAAVREVVGAARRD
jgi:hypothetical protein